MKISEFQKVIETICIETWHDCKSPKFRHFPSVFGWGLYGIGKSSAVAQVAAKHEVGFIDKRLAEVAEEYRAIRANLFPNDPLT